MEDRLGIVIGNTGTPDAPTPHAVKRYLKHFLMDPRIRPMNAIGWWCILHFAILPKRAKASAAKYERIWTEEGSPLTADCARLAHGIQRRFNDAGADVFVTSGMSYGNPSMKQAVKACKDEGCTRLLFLPLYPQHSHSSSQACIDAFGRGVKAARFKGQVQVAAAYGDDPGYIAAIAALILEAGFDVDGDDKLVMSFHAVPLKDIEAGDEYELQVGSTCVEVADVLGIERNRWTVGYQSIFGNKPETWTAPEISGTLAGYGAAGITPVYFVCPGFSVDCLETIYEVEHDIAPAYLSAFRPGEQGDTSKFIVVQCLNATKAHAKVLSDYLAPYVTGDVRGNAL